MRSHMSPLVVVWSKREFRSTELENESKRIAGSKDTGFLKCRLSRMLYLTAPPVDQTMVPDPAMPPDSVAWTSPGCVVQRIGLAAVPLRPRRSRTDAGSPENVPFKYTVSPATTVATAWPSVAHGVDADVPLLPSFPPVAAT